MTMSPDPLVQKIGKQGDALLKTKVIRSDEDGYDIPFDQHVPYRDTMLTVKLHEKLNPNEESPENLPIWAGIFAVVFVDIAVKIVFFPIYLAAILFWFAERGWSRLKKRSFFCPFCTNPSRDPLVYCPKCQRVQPRIRPSFRAPLVWRCGCGKYSWFTVGQYAFGSPGPLCCRDLPTVTGCYRPHPAPELAGRTHAVHTAIAGTSTRAKHAVMAHLFKHLSVGSLSETGPCDPAWDVSADELKLCETRLNRSFLKGEETTDCETPGTNYTFAQSFMLDTERGRLLVYHNVAQQWLRATESLVRKGLNWELVSGLVFVLDPEKLSGSDLNKFPQAEAWSHLVQAVEQYCGVPPGQPLPLKVAVVLPVPDAKTFSDFWKEADPTARDRGMSEVEVRDLVRRRDPALYALLTRCLHPNRLAYFGGTIPPSLDLKRTFWLCDALQWVL